MYGQMTAGSWIYIGTQGIVQGTYETFAELARQHFGGSLRGRVRLTAGVGGMGGAQPLAITMNGGVALVVDVDRARLERRRELRYLDASPTRAKKRCARSSARDAPARRSRSATKAMRRSSFPQLYELGFRPDAVTDQTSAHDLLNGYVPAGVTLDEAAALRKRDPARIRTARAGELRRARCRRWCAISTPAPSCSTTATTFARKRSAPASRARSLSRASCRRSFGRCSAAAPGRFGLRRSRAIRADIARCDAKLLELFPARRVARALDPARARTRRVPRVAGAHLLARLRRSRQGGPGVQRTRAQRRDQGADRDRPRSSRYRQRRVALSRDRSDERRQRRDRRLADPQRAAQHGGRRALGELPSRRRRRHRLQPARRHGRRRRRQRRCARAAALRADDRLRDGRRAPRRRGLRDRDRNGRRKRHRLASSDRPRARRSSPATPTPRNAASLSTRSGASTTARSLVEDGAHRRGRPACATSSASSGDETARTATTASIVPGLVDAHAHPLFAGDREPDFAARLRGEPPPLGMRVHGRTNARGAARSERLLRTTIVRRGCARCSRTARRRSKRRPATRCTSPANRRCSI